ncbi:type I-E CRISPR-associated protein Cse1/CasA [Geobacter sulfurreducens]|uniref:type I-E CRISPR-associated protein Cse1/CasA n=1 Tax=Geobacter sulfurreducens TaxID=35554 RepID=UPI0005D9D4DE|nr:type I-E CRISPR-associated protein Cse1/CasA [Geobacter sulfurreducens]AJY71729.1 hypothetical protein RW64_20365 [Geobacter sulfurreducens]QVW36571.1 type I-E CRISPR-associated protein Cse1/CasA [Geobacter sulfurreducens]UTG94037.1 type I-E CRISPR-associated protein Cse1/CasA [Geobacter sulfurreducens]
MDDFSYNLVDEPWIACVGLDGTQRMGFRDLLVRAHELREIECQNPLALAALLRVLLALVHRIVDGPRKTRDWTDLYTSGRFPEKQIAAYFRDKTDRFDLFSETHPFYQTPGLSLVDSVGKPSPVTVAGLMIERASGNNKTIFDHTTDEMPVALSPAEAAHALITAQMYSLGGIYKKTTNLFGYFFRWENAVMVDGINIVLTGKTLFETLMLNLLIYGSNEPIPNNPEDCPVWERDDIGNAVGKRDEAMPPRGYLDFLTCKCRHILLVPMIYEDNVVVQQAHVAPGELFLPVNNPGFLSKESKKGTQYHPQLDVNRLVWRDSLALFAFKDGVYDHRPKAFRQAAAMKQHIQLTSRYLCMAIAIANEDANPLAWRKETLSVPLALLESKEVVAILKAAMSRSEEIAIILDSSVKNFMREALPKNSKDVNDKANASGALRFYWDRLEHHFSVFLADIEKGDVVLDAWYAAVAATARVALESCVRQRYADTARTLKAWASATDYLNARLVGLNANEGGSKQ